MPYYPDQDLHATSKGNRQPENREMSALHQRCTKSLTQAESCIVVNVTRHDEHESHSATRNLRQPSSPWSVFTAEGYLNGNEDPETYPEHFRGRYIPMTLCIPPRRSYPTPGDASQTFLKRASPSSFAYRECAVIVQTRASSVHWLCTHGR